MTEPPPDNLFELSGGGLAYVTPREPARNVIEVFEQKALEASPSTSNLLRPQSFREALTRVAPPPGKRNTAALAIPDYAVRMTILDFEDFPPSHEDRTALIRFRLRKSVPFHIDEAQVAYAIQFQEAKRVEVLAIAVARPILEEYETLFTDAGYRLGLVIPSCVAALPLFEEQPGLTLVAKLAGTALSMLLLEAGRVRLVRCLDLAAGEGGESLPQEEHVLTLLQQTVAFAEDQIGHTVARLLLCGFGPETDELGRMAEQDLGLPYAVARSRFGAASQANAGLLGLVEQYAA